MPVYYISYTTKNDDHAIKHDIDWVTPGGWTSEQAIESFKQRHPEASITQFIQDPFYPSNSDQLEPCQSLSSADS